MAQSHGNGELIRSVLLMLRHQVSTLESEANPIDSSRRIEYSVLGVTDSLQVNRHACIFRMVSIVESYVDALCGHEIDQLARDANRVFLNLLAAENERRTRSWNNRLSAFRLLLGVNLQQCPHWEEFGVAVEARNTIAHGLGHLSIIARDYADVRTKFQALELNIRDGRLIVSSSAVDRTFGCCQGIVCWIDSVLWPS